jgi:2-haloacid dehalogenase
VRDHQLLAGDQASLELRVQPLARQVVPAVESGAVRDDPESMDRWATFDCYGTLIDWNRGIGRELARLFGADDAGRLLSRYHELEPQVQHEDATRTYRDVLNVTLARLAESEGHPLSADESDALARSLPDWPAFPEVRKSLEEARSRGFRLAILSNTDRDLVDASIRQLGVEIELAIVASEIGSWKPSPWHWEVFLARSGADRDHVVHVAQSLFHDVAPCVQLGLPVVWINRLDEEAKPRPTRELRSLAGLADTLEELV